MPNAYVLSMQKPHEAMMLPISMPKRLTALGHSLWVGVSVVLVMASAVNYVYQVNNVSTKGFALHQLEQQLALLDETVTSLDNQTVSLQSMSNLQDRVKTMGYIPVTKVEFLGPQEKDMALR